MEEMLFNPELGEKEKYTPRYLIFFGRHAEPAKRSIFDAVGGEKGIRMDNFEESSLTLRGVVDSSLLNYDLLGEVTKRMPKGKIKIILSNTRAYRTQETVNLIKEKLESEAKSLGREVVVEIGDLYLEPLLNENRQEERQQSDSDIKYLIEAAEANSLPDQGLVYFGITHDAKLSNFLNSNGIKNEGVDTSEFLTITDEGKGKNLISFRDKEVLIDLKPSSDELAQE